MKLPNCRNVLTAGAGLLAALSLCLGGCSPQPDALPDKEDTAQEFSQITNDFFQWMASQDYLTQRRILSDPEAEGIEACSPSLPDVSENPWNHQVDMAKSLRFQLDLLDKTALDYPQQNLYDLLFFSVDSQMKGEGLESFRLLTFLSPETGLMTKIPRILGQLSFTEPEDVEEYFSLLEDLPRLFNDLVQYIGQQQEISFTSSWLEDAQAACAPYCLDPDHNGLTQSFLLQLDHLPGLSDQERQAYEERHAQAVTEFVIPAYQQLSQALKSLPPRADQEEGLWRLEGGRKYYEYLVLTETGTSFEDLSQLKSALEEQLQRNTKTMNELLAQSPELMAEIHFSQEFGNPESLLSFLAAETNKYFPALDEESLHPEVLSQELSPLWDLPCWQPPALNEPLEHSTLWIDWQTAGNPDSLYPALAEKGYPGSFYREAYRRSLDSEKVQALLSFPGWERGWDAYARSYALSFDNGLSREAKQLARLSYSSSLAIQGLIDIQVNYYGWGVDEVKDFLAGYYQVDQEQVWEALYRRAAYAPGLSLSYCTGYLEIRQMKSRARDVLGDAFQEMEFHRFLLETGPGPFSLLRNRLDNWIVQQNMSSLSR